MTYGVYTKDLTGTSLQEQYNIEDARCWLSPGHVICTEKKVCTGFSITVAFNKFWDFKLKPSRGYLVLGFVEISWHKKQMTWADKVVEEAKEEGADEEAVAKKAE